MFTIMMEVSLENNIEMGSLQSTANETSVLGS